MFSMSNQAAKLAHINVREEKHGEESVPAVDLTIKCDVPNTFLANLAPTLRWSLYDKAATVDAVDPDHMPVLRYPSMDPFRWRGEARALVAFPGTKPRLEFVAKVNNLDLDPLEGGTVRISFRVQAVVESPEIGVLAALLGADIKVSITPSATPKDVPAAGEPKRGRKAKKQTEANDGGRNEGDLLQ